MPGINLHIYQSTFTHESRILKITKTITDAGCFDQIRIIARHESGLEEHESIDGVRQVVRTRTRFFSRYRGVWKIFATLEWTLRVILQERRSDIRCINCHSLVVLPLCVFMKWQHRCKLIYDTHELETETSSSRGVRKRIAKLIERKLIRHANAVITVTKSISKWYQREYSLDNVTVVRNMPARPTTEIIRSSALRSRLKITDGYPLFIYLGSLAHHRGVERLLRAFAELDDRHVVFVGFGPLVGMVKEYAAENDNIHFLDAVPTHEVLQVASGADVGLALLENTSINHYYCLGNKVFEYLQCGLPVVVSDFPEMGGLITQHDCGWKTNPDSDQTVKETIAAITRDDIQAREAKAMQCRQELVWENEEPGLLAVYDELAGAA